MLVARVGPGASDGTLAAVELDHVGVAVARVELGAQPLPESLFQRAHGLFHAGRQFVRRTAHALFQRIRPRLLHCVEARPLRRFWTITFPLLSPTAFFLLVVNIVYAFFDTFGVIHAITRGGPSYATNILVYKVYNDGFINLDLGGSAAQSVILAGQLVPPTANRPRPKQISTRQGMNTRL